MSRLLKCNSTSAVGAAEGSQGQAALRAAPGSGFKEHSHALKGRLNITEGVALACHHVTLKDSDIQIWRTSLRPFRAVVLEDLIQGLRAKPLAPGYLLPRLRRWVSETLEIIALRQGLT